MLCKLHAFQFLNRSPIIRRVAPTLITRTRIVVVEIEINLNNEATECLGQDSSKSVQLK